MSKKKSSKAPTASKAGPYHGTECKQPYHTYGTAAVCQCTARSAQAPTIKASSFREALDKHCENMRPGSTVPYTTEFKDSWEIRESFEAGWKAALASQAHHDSQLTNDIKK